VQYAFQLQPCYHQSSHAQDLQRSRQRMSMSGDWRGSGELSLSAHHLARATMTAGDPPCVPEVLPSALARGKVPARVPQSRCKGGSC
ncbi:hypothetical protein FB451DRAFT_1468371, partial [Mycena latifolia]